MYVIVYALVMLALCSPYTNTQAAAKAGMAKKKKKKKKINPAPAAAVKINPEAAHAHKVAGAQRPCVSSWLSAAMKHQGIKGLPAGALDRNCIFEDIMGMSEKEFQAQVGTVGQKPSPKDVNAWF